MSRSESAAELSMEDILASIRSLVPADQRGAPGEPQASSAPPVPPTTNRLGDFASPPTVSTMPLGSMPPQRQVRPFEDDLADILDDPAEAASPSQSAVPAPQPMAFTPPYSAPKAAEPSPRPLPDFDALFGRSALKPAQAPTPAPQAQSFEEDPAASVPHAAPVEEASQKPSVPPLMGLGQSGFIPSPFGKRAAPPPPVAPPADAKPSEFAAHPTGVPPLKRSFFPASFQAQPPAPPVVEPVLEMPSPQVEAQPEPVPVEAEISAGAASPTPVSEERPSYSDALDQALKRLQGLGSLVPEAPAAVAIETPKAAAEAPQLDPRFFGATPPSVEDAPKPHQPQSLSEGEAVALVASDAVDELVEAPAADVEKPQAHAHAPTVRLSDALWSKSAPSAEEPSTLLPPERAFPEAVEFMDVPPASPMVKALGALALGLAGGSAAVPQQEAVPANAAVPPQEEVASLPHTPLVVEDLVVDPVADVIAPEGALSVTPLVEPLMVAEIAAAPVPEQPPQAGGANRSLEDVVADMLRPMLKQWIEDNMPRIMEKALRAESSSKRD